MHQSPGLSRRDLVDAEFIRPRMQAQLIRSQGARNSSMGGEVCCECGQITNIVYTLLEAPNVARRQTHPSDTQSAQLVCQIHVFGVGGGRLCLVYRDLNLPGTP